jgi:serine/threonine-protein kinase ATR
MEDEDVEALLEPTFFIIHHYWSSFTPEIKDDAVHLMTDLLKQFRDVIHGYIDFLPSLKHIDELKVVNRQLEPMRSSLDDEAKCAIFVQRLRREHSGVVLLALKELADYLRIHQDYLQTSAISERPDSVVPSLIRALLDCSAKYHGVRADLALACTECIGLVGCLDSNRLESTREEEQLVVVDNFEDAVEVIEFVLFMLEKVLMKAFLSPVDNLFQGYLSFVMQELLDKAGFKDNVPMRPNSVPCRRWFELSETTRQVLTPFLSSKYVIKDMEYRPVEYPIFRPGKGYANWLRALVLNLLQNGQKDSAKIFFLPLSRVIRVKDLSIAEFLLPYAVVHVVCCQELGRGKEEDDKLSFQRKIIGELHAILTFELPEGASDVERQDLRRCVEVRNKSIPRTPSPPCLHCLL